MIEWCVTSPTRINRNGGVRMSTRVRLGAPEPRFFAPGNVVTTRPDHPVDEVLATVIACDRELRKLLALRMGALKQLLAAGQSGLDGLKDLACEAIGDIPVLDRRTKIDFASRALQPDFNLFWFHRIVTHLPETGKAFLAAFSGEPSIENAEALYMWCTDLDRTIANYLEACSPDRGSISVTVRSESVMIWRTKSEKAASAPLDLCAG